GGVTGDDEHRDGDALTGKALEQLQTLHVGQEIVEQDQVKGSLRKDDEGVGAGPAAEDLVVGTFEGLADEQGDVIVILDQEQPQDITHDWLLAQAGSLPRSRSRIGSRSVTVVPSPMIDSNVSRPAQRATAWRTKKNPRPMPPPEAGGPPGGTRLAANGSIN